MPKVLLVSVGVYPMPAGSAVIVNNLATQFSPNEMVIAGQKTFINQEDEWGEQMPKIYHLDYNISLLGKGKKYLRWLNFDKLVNKLEDIVEVERCDRILAVFPDEYYTYAAYVVAKKMNLPFYSWFHNTYLDNRSGVLKYVANHVQPKVFEYSKKIFTMSEGMNDFCRERYPEYKSKFEPLLHGFVIPKRHSISIDTEISRPLKFLLTGNINKSNEDATIRLVNTILEENPSNELHIYGINSVAYWKKKGINSPNVYTYGFIPLQELVSKFDDFDIMLLPHGFEGGLSEVEYLTIFPTRTIPLLYSGKPILAHMPTNTAIAKMLKSRDCAFVVEDKDKQQIAKAINELVNVVPLRQKLVSKALLAATEYNVENTARQLKKEIFDEA